MIAACTATLAASHAARIRESCKVVIARIGAADDLTASQGPDLMLYAKDSAYWRDLPEVADLALGPQMADHLMWGASLGWVLARRRKTRRSQPTP